VTLCHLVQSELRLYIFLASCKRSFQWWFLSLIHYNLYTLLDPILYAHWRYLICKSWPEDGCNAAETCSHEPLIYST